MSEYVDTTELTRLARELADNADEFDKSIGPVLDRIANGVMTDAVSNANSYNGTGELAAATKMTRTGNKQMHSRKIGAEVDQALWLEVGSPTTGGPRPWLTGPAAKGHYLLGLEIEKRAVPL
jgi:hypothetical protein